MDPQLIMNQERTCQNLKKTSHDTKERECTRSLQAGKTKAFNFVCVQMSAEQYVSQKSIWLQTLLLNL